MEDHLGNNVDKAIERVIHDSRRKACSRIARRELKTHLLITALFRSFHIESRVNPKAQEGQNRSRIQEIIDRNIILPSGHYHFNDFCEDGFSQELQKEFVLTPKTP